VLAASAEVQGRKIILCVTGGIAAYKVAFVARTLAQLGADVRVAMTQSAQRFVGDQTLGPLTGSPVSTELYGTGADVPHVELARGADLVIVAPATANVLAKMASGLADDIVSATLLTATCPILAAPAMHREMWQHPATRANLATLVDRGVTLVGPDEGPLSSGDEGPGRMAEPDAIVNAATELLGRAQVLADKRVLVTAGGTQEPLDPVRFVGNRSSGRMGFAVARAAAARGAKVTLVAGPTELTPPPGVDLVAVKTAAEMREAVLERATIADIIVKAAAVADFRPEISAAKKLKKAAGPPKVVLVPNADILAELGSGRAPRKEGGILVGFAAETEPDPARLAELAMGKRRSKGADLIVANDVSSPDSGFNVRTNRAVIAGPAGVEDLGLVSKDALAEAILDAVLPLLPGPGPGN
jgi:phosphopantothenoylcysteine decarboxylase / phosphopantothenate---cysteine ligase